MTLKIAFLDHPFHRKTKSSNFFVKILEQDFLVDTYYIESDSRDLLQIIVSKDYDTIVCWQTEYCAPYLLAKSQRVVCIPMYDGVANAPDIYWTSMRQARFFSFSQAIHRKLLDLDIESYHFQYFNADHIALPQADFSNGLKFFFWQRRPEDGLSASFAERVAKSVVAGQNSNTQGGQLHLPNAQDAGRADKLEPLSATSVLSAVTDRQNGKTQGWHLHVHNAPDAGRADKWEPLCATSVSTFLPSADRYRKLLSEANVFICPRYTEGIGMTMLEALARGMFVVAHNEPTANEYITDGVNGALIDFYKYRDSNPDESLESPKLQDLNVTLCGQVARQRYLEGIDRWREKSKEINFLIRTTPQADLRLAELELADDALDASRYGQVDFDQYISELRQLARKGFSGKEASNLSRKDIAIFRLENGRLARTLGKISDFIRGFF